MAFVGDLKHQLDAMKRGTVDIYSDAELAEKVKKSLSTGKPLRVKLGIDPTTADIHLGHTVVLRKLRQFQDLGHQAVLIIGDFTALIGDPSGRDKTRPQITPEKIELNAKTYLDQVGNILDISKLEITHNGEWLGKLSFHDIIKLAAKITVARILEREDFTQRMKKATPISLHELLYPLMQGYDSVAVKADVELGGTDQLFNLLTGRDLQRDDGLEPQIALTMPILVGLDGTNKMSKSYGNYIGVKDAPNDMFGKVMSMPDNLMKDYFILLTDKPLAEIEALIASTKNPRDVKVVLGKTIVAQFHGAAAGVEAAEHFDKVFSKKELPDDMPETRLPADIMRDGKVSILKLIMHCGFADSTSNAKRLLEQGAVSMDSNKITDFKHEFAPVDGMVLKVGKKNKFCKIKI